MKNFEFKFYFDILCSRGCEFLEFLKFHPKLTFCSKISHKR